MTSEALDEWQTFLAAVFVTALTVAGVALIAGALIYAALAAHRVLSSRWRRW